MNSKLLKSITCVVIIAGILTSHFLQKGINKDRSEMGLTRLEVLENAPPLLTFTTVALGGFRGLIVNVLWTRMTDLGDQDRYFETIQLADWITKLEPTFAAVWAWQAWNLAYNISIKFNEPLQRWHWVYSGIRLLRDQGLKYNPTAPEIYRELAWFYQNKIGYYLDDCHVAYKAFWIDEMTKILGDPQTCTNADLRPVLPAKGVVLDWDVLFNPKTEKEKERVRRLKEDYKLDPEHMKKVDDKYGPLEWRLPDAHAIYWGALGMEKARKGADVMPLRRTIYQPLLLSFHRGRLVRNIFDKTWEFRPNLDAIANTDKAYQEFADQDPEYHDHILKAHKNFLKDAIYFLYTYNRIAEASHYFQEFAKLYPDQSLLSGDPQSTPDRIALDEFVVERVEEDVRDDSPDRVRGILEGMLFSSFYALALGEEEEATGYAAMALKIWQKYTTSVGDEERTVARMGLPPFQSLRQEALNQFLKQAETEDPLLADALRVRLNIPKEESTPAEKTDTQTTEANK